MQQSLSARGAGCLAAFGAAAVAALELVPGGYGAGADGSGSAGAPERARLELAGDAGRSPACRLELHAAARHRLWARPRSATSATGCASTLPCAAARQPLDQLGLGDVARRAAPGNAQAARAALTVGGAMHWSDWSVGGGLGRAEFMGDRRRPVVGHAGLRPPHAELAYGQSQSTTRAEPRDVLMLSTDLAAWSWLTLESDLAVGSRSRRRTGSGPQREPVAAGRFGLRLNF